MVNTMPKNKETQISTPSSPRPLKLGWDEYYENQLASMDTKGCKVGRVMSVQRNGFIVNDGQDDLLCNAAGRLIKSSTEDYPVTGDWVLIKETTIKVVIPRKNAFSRGEAGSRGGRSGGAQRVQVIGANLDTVFIVSGLDRDFNIRRLERYLTLAHNCGIPPVIVLTKADMHDAPETFQLEAEAIAFDIHVVLTSSQDHRGTDELAAYLGEGKTVAMIGSSGAGKSTLANMLLGEEIQATGDISDSVGKGRHTTTTRELIKMPQGGLLMDNPGIREVAFHDSGDGVESSFADIVELAQSCKFGDCSHENEPGCAVRQAVKKGKLDKDRLESFHKTQRELDYLSTRQTKSADRIEKERWKGVAQHIKRMKKTKR